MERFDSSQFNLEQLLSSGFQNNVLESNKVDFSNYERKTFEKIANISYNKYIELKEHPNFTGYLENMTSLKYYSQTNIGSRPSSRSKSKNLNFEDLRAILLSVHGVNQNKIFLGFMESELH